MNYGKKIVEIAKEHMTENLWKGIDQRMPSIWHKSTSSTGKWHKKKNGEVPDCAEHVYHMLYTAVKIFRLFSIEKQTTDADKIIIAILLHDALKYGMLGNNMHTCYSHDKDAADMVSQNKGTFLKLFTEEQFVVMEEAIRFHSGQWSTDAKYELEFSFANYNPETLFVHMLDMMSAADLIQTDVRE